MRVIHRNQVITLCIVLLLPLVMDAQTHILQHDAKLKSRLFHFGLSLGLNKAQYKVAPSQLLYEHENINTIRSPYGPGFHVGIVSNVRISDYFDLRFIPTLAFAERRLEFDQLGDSTVVKPIEGVNLNFPLHLKFKSKPYHDMRFYVIGGVSALYDVASNAKARKNEDLVKVRAGDIALEYGVGLELHFEFFTLSPEFKVSHGLGNVIVQEPLIYSRVIDQLKARAFYFSLHFEG